MEQYISKDAVVAEIERRRDLHYKYCIKNGIGSIAECKYDEDKYILSFLNTLEVKEVKEPTASDRDMAEEIIINLKRVEQDYRIDLTKEMEWVRSKVKKGG